jgi:hypothetical protein
VRSPCRQYALNACVPLRSPAVAYANLSLPKLGYNAVLCNLYRNGNDSVGLHADAEPEGELYRGQVKTVPRRYSAKALQHRPRRQGVHCSRSPHAQVPNLRRCVHTAWCSPALGRNLLRICFD